MPFTKGENKWAWIFEGKTDLCGVSCRGKHCHTHNVAIKKGKKGAGTRPCLGCLRGLRGLIPICTRCGGNAYRALLIHYKNRTTTNIKNKYPPTPEEYMERIRLKQATTQRAAPDEPAETRI